MLKGFVSGEEKDIKRIPMKGVNVLESTITSGTIAGVTYTVNPDKSITLNGAMTGTSSYFVIVGYIDAEQGVAYTISGVNGFTATTLQLFTDSSVAFAYGNRLQCFNGPVTRTAAGNQRCRVNLYFYPNQTYDNVTIHPQVIVGSTPLPYEPYGYQEGWEVRDNQDRLVWGREDELQTATGTLPFKGYGLPVKVKSLLGNAVQNGTPAPDNIITPEMCGVRTGNLANLYGVDRTFLGLHCTVSEDMSVVIDGTKVDGVNVRPLVYPNIILSAGTYTVKVKMVGGSTTNLSDGLFFGINQSTYGQRTTPGVKQVGDVGKRTFTLNEDTLLSTIDVAPGYASGGSVWENATFECWFYSGSDEIDYEPYGWKIPLTCAGQTTPVYLGEVPTVRRVKKLVLDGTENWYGYTESSAAGVYRLELNGYLRVNTNIALSTHFETQSSVEGATRVNEKSIAFLVSASGNNYMYIKYRAMGNVADFKAFLASEYAAGTPVTVWYVLATEQTAISNEPLTKIGTYADELTTIQVHGLSAPLYGIGDYKDTLNLSTGVVTRKVKKLVLTGTEQWGLWSSGQPDVERYYYKWGKSTPSDYGLICTHLPFRNADGNFEHIRLGGSSRDDFVIYISKTIAPTVTDFKAYLAAQYQAGTPVTAWYILSTPTTETVTVPTGMTGEIEGYLTQVSTPTPTNRSVPKWNGVEETGGTYAVTVYTPPEIPTTTGQNTLTVETEKIHGLTNPLCGIGDYKDVLNLSTGVITRKVKKLVLDGTENWSFASSDTNRTVCDILLRGCSGNFLCCSHIEWKSAYSTEEYNRIVWTNTSGGTLFVSIENTYLSGRDVAAFKSYLAAQYTSGTPVTVWYVLSTSEKETITVPYGLECSVEGYLTQSTTPAPSSPITPDSNGILESDGTYAIEVSLVPSNLTVKGHIKELT